MDNKDLKNGIKYASLGIEFASMILGLGLVGYYIDKKLGSTPLFLIVGIFFGFISGIYRLYKISKIISRNDKNDRDNKN